MKARQCRPDEIIPSERTVNGNLCQRWDATYPHNPLDNIKNRMPHNKAMLENFCNNFGE